jgi:hypothetical protein
MEERANRQLDGMNVNRDAMARDVIHLVAILRDARTAIENLQRTQQKPSIYQDAFKDIFKGIFK